MSVAAIGLTFGVSTAAAQRSGPRTWYVKAGGAGGDGSIARPFGSLAAVERAAAAGDTIMVLASPSGAAPLDGGIALKPDQRLVGGGPSVSDLGAAASAPRITNTTTAHSGDAVTVADRTEVSNIVVAGASRGGIYGQDVKNVTVAGNDVNGTNTSCTAGFVVQPFVLPLLVPGAGVPFSSGLSNGWAAIMLDESHTTTTVSVAHNYVHDSGCADGIDVRASGTADVTARIEHNTLTRLRQDPSKQSELAIGMQTTDTGRLDANIDGNAETYIGTATAGDFGDSDSEGVFGNSAGHSHLIENIDHNTFAHGLGHVSANCVETAASNGGPTMNITLANSSCRYVVGDILEAANLSADATLTFDVDHVLADHSTFAGSQAWAQAEPGDDGDCMLEVASGAHGTTAVNISSSRFTDCVADGLGVVSNVVDGSGPVKALSFDVRNSSISSNKLSNLRIATATPIAELDGRIEHSDISESAGTNVILENLDTSGATHARLDFGGGAFSSQGHNCIDGGQQGDVSTVDYDLEAKDDWWGAPDGPGPGSTLAAGGAVTYAPALHNPDCGPTIGPPPKPVRASAGCRSSHRITFRLPRGWRRATVTIDRRRAHVKRVRGRLIATVHLHRATPRMVVVRAHGIGRHRRRVELLRRYQPCR